MHLLKTLGEYQLPQGQRLDRCLPHRFLDVITTASTANLMITCSSADSEECLAQKKQNCAARVHEAVQAAEEEERKRRIMESNSTLSSGNRGDRVSMLMQLIRGQTLSFQSLLGQEISKYGAYCQSVFSEREERYMQAISLVVVLSEEIWPSAEVHPYGSYASGLMTPESDIDLVVCMEGDVSWRSSSQEWFRVSQVALPSGPGS